MLYNNTTKWYVQKRECVQEDFAFTEDLREKIKESEKRDKYLGLAGEQEKVVGHDSGNDTYDSWCTCNKP